MVLNNNHSSSSILKCSVCHNEYKSQRSLSMHLSLNPACASKKRKKMSPLGNSDSCSSTYKKNASPKDDNNYKSYNIVPTSSTSTNAMHDHLNGNSNGHSENPNGSNDDTDHNHQDMRNVPYIKDPNFFLMMSGFI